MRSVLDLFDKVVQLDRSIPDEAHVFAMNISEPGWLADMIATSLSLNFEARWLTVDLLRPGTEQDLGRTDVGTRRRSTECATRDKMQREYYLRECAANPERAGRGRCLHRDAAELKRRIQAANLRMSPKPWP
jgi:ATP-dependent Lon protease